MINKGLTELIEYREERPASLSSEECRKNIREGLDKIKQILEDINKNEDIRHNI